MKRLALFAMVVGLAACAGSMRESGALSNEESAYLDRLDSVETTFTLPVDVADIAWDRSRHFIDKYSWVMIQSVNDREMRTFNPPSGSTRIGYLVQRKQEGDDVQFDVQCVSGASSAVGTAFRNARILALYMKTGELPPTRRLIAK